jgi:hypothetical protein
MNEGYRWKEKLFSEKGRAQLEKLSLAPWASRRRKELWELLDQLDPKTAELTAAVEQEAKKRPRSVGTPTLPVSRNRKSWLWYGTWKIQVLTHRISHHQATN